MKRTTPGGPRAGSLLDRIDKCCRAVIEGNRTLMQHEIQVRVRYQEADPMGLLHHANYFTYFETARTEMLRAAGGNYRRMEEEGLLVVVVRAECRYHEPARYDDLLTVRILVKRVTPAKIEHEYHVLRDGRRLATGRVTLALVDRRGNVQRVPDWLLEPPASSAGE